MRAQRTSTNLNLASLCESGCAVRQTTWQADWGVPLHKQRQGPATASAQWPRPLRPRSHHQGQAGGPGPPGRRACRFKLLVPAARTGASAPLASLAQPASGSEQEDSLPVGLSASTVTASGRTQGARTSEADRQSELERTRRPGPGADRNPEIDSEFTADEAAEPAALCEQAPIK